MTSQSIVMITSHVKNIDITELIDAIGLNETQKKPHGVLSEPCQMEIHEIEIVS